MWSSVGGCLAENLFLLKEENGGGSDYEPLPVTLSNVLGETYRNEL